MTTPAARAREIAPEIVEIVLAMTELATRRKITFPAGFVNMSDPSGLIVPVPERIAEMVSDKIEREITRAASDAFERAAKVVETTESRMCYGPGVDDCTIASVEGAIGGIRHEAAAAIRALATQEAHHG